MERFSVKNIIIIVLCLILGIVFIIVSFVALSNKKEDYSNIENYTNNLENLRARDDIRSKLSIFPSNIKIDEVKEYKYYSKHNFLNRSYFIYLVVNYSEEEYNNEIGRIESINVPFSNSVKNILFSKTGFKYPAYITVWDGNGTYEYVLTDEKNHTIIYVYNQLFEWDDIDINQEYKSVDYSVSTNDKDVNQNGYSIYYYYDKNGNETKFN